MTALGKNLRSPVPKWGNFQRPLAYRKTKSCRQHSIFSKVDILRVVSAYAEP